MKILYVGDIMAGPGRQVAISRIPALRQKHDIDVVIAQAENVTHGKSMAPHHMRELQSAGVNFFTGGNHSPKRKDLHEFMANPAQPVTLPANLEEYPTEWGAKLLETPHGTILVASLLGQTVPTTPPVANPLHTIDRILQVHAGQRLAATIVNFHGDYSSEKRVIGYYLDGRVSAVIGDHWHVPTADAMVLPMGTAHITDVGMCGTLHSSLGVELSAITKRWHDKVPTTNVIAEGPPYQFNAVLITVDPANGLATTIEPINEVLEKIS